MSVSTNCLDVLYNYANFINANATSTDVTGYRPHPLFFSGTNCSGEMWPPMASEPSVGTMVANPSKISGNPAAFGSFYVPQGWSVTLYSNGNSGQFPSAGTTLPLLIADVSTTLINSQYIINAVQTIMMNPPSSAPAIANWQFQMCTGSLYTLVGAQRIVAWRPGSIECDAFMTSYCAPVATQGCDANSTEVGVIESQYLPCVCMIEQNCLQATFCEAGSTNPSCQSNSAFALFIPPTCFGKRCSSQGYRWGYMQQQKCNLTLCQQIISLVGNDIIVSGSSTLYCGETAIPVALTSIVSPSVSPSDVVTAELEAFSTTIWLLIGIVGFVVLITVPLAIIVYRRSAKAEAQSDRDYSRGITSRPQG
jgi:hypothetical protein